MLESTHDVMLLSTETPPLLVSLSTEKFKESSSKPGNFYNLQTFNLYFCLQLISLISGFTQKILWIPLILQ